MGIKNLAIKATKGTAQAYVDFRVGRSLRNLAGEISADIDQSYELTPEEQVMADLSQGMGDSELSEAALEQLRKQGINPSDYHIVSMSMSDLVRRCLYDSGTEDPEQILKEMGWSVPSSEVIEMEVKASEDRVEKIADLSPLVHSLAYAALAPSAITDNWDDEEVRYETEFLAHACIASISQLVDMGLLDVGIPLAGVGHYAEERDSDE